MFTFTYSHASPNSGCRHIVTSDTDEMSEHVHRVTQTSRKIASPRPYWIPDQSKLHPLFSKHPVRSLQPSMARFMVYGDCRANNLPHQVAIKNYTSATVHVEPNSGVGILGLVAYAYTKACPHDTILLCPGVGDLLYTDLITGMLSLRFNLVTELSDHVTGLLNEGEVNFHKAYPRSHIIFGTIA